MRQLGDGENLRLQTAPRAARGAQPRRQDGARSVAGEPW
jgi:hypothetical protein